MRQVWPDEDASGQDSRVHQEKLDFLESKINDTSFFFKQREWRELSKRFEISTKDAEKLHNDYKAKRQQHESRIAAINGTRYAKKSATKATHSENSSDT